MSSSTLYPPLAIGASSPAEDESFSDVLANVRTAIAENLRPHIREIDARGWYPEPFLRRLGAAGGYRQAVPSEYGGAGRGLTPTIRLMEEVSRECLSTGFCVWCQSVCAWYIQNSSNEPLKQRLLTPVANGEILGGTGLSNPMKHFAGIEKIRLTAARRPGGYVFNGALPWVSNAGVDHVFAAVAKIDDSDDYVMAVIPGDLRGVTIGDGGHFIALEGSSTHNAVFSGAFVADDWVLAGPCSGYVQRIRPGFILSQSGFGLGLIDSCIDLMRRSNERVGHVNAYLEDGADEIAANLDSVRGRVYRLADRIGCGLSDPGPDAMREAITARLEVSELSLRASQAAMLHAGAAGYRQGSAAERKLRESYFVAVVTPALKQLKKMLHDIPPVTPC